MAKDRRHSDFRIPGESLSATDPPPRPGDFPLGSVESRAAARLALDQESGDRRIVIVSHVPRPGLDPTKKHVGPWQACPDGRRLRVVYEPA